MEGDTEDRHWLALPLISRGGCCTHSPPLALLEQKDVVFGLLICLLFTGTNPRPHWALTTNPTSTAERFSGNQPGHANAPSL